MSTQITRWAAAEKDERNQLIIDKDGFVKCPCSECGSATSAYWEYFGEHDKSHVYRCLGCIAKGPSRRRGTP